MRCIFCKTDTVASSSVEHIVSESLGNTDHVLPKGIVCDACNNYLACKVEKPVLDSGIFRLIRNRQNVTNKRGNLPAFSTDDIANLPDYRLMSRFLGKVGLEALASRVLHVADWNNELVEKPELDALRSYVRFNIGPESWPFAYRTLYPVNAVFREENIHFEVLHEFQLLYTPGHEIYIVLALFGVEFVLNLGGHELDGFEKWLKEHNYESPLYPAEAA